MAIWIALLGNWMQPTPTAEPGWLREFLWDYALWNLLDFVIHTPEGHALGVAALGGLLTAIGRIWAPERWRRDLWVASAVCTAIVVVIAMLELTRSASDAFQAIGDQERNLNRRLDYLAQDLISMEQDLRDVGSQVESVREELDCRVMPRTLRGDRAKGVSEYLRRYDRHHAVITFVPGDDEAVTYAGQLRAALIKGGWTADFVPAQKTQPGVWVHPFVGYDPSEDPKHPSAATLVREALGQIIGGGSSGGSAESIDVTIDVGPRPSTLCWVDEPEE